MPLFRARILGEYRSRVLGDQFSIIVKRVRARRGSGVSVAMFDGIKVRSATTPTQSVISVKKQVACNSAPPGTR